MIAKKVSDNIMPGRKCVFCGKYGLYRLKDKRLKCRHCRRSYSLKKIRKDLTILYYFCLELSARRTAKEPGLSYMTVHDRFMHYRYKI